MLMLKKSICITLFLCMIIVPTSAFASNNSNSVNNQTSSNNRVIDKYLSYFSGNNQGKDDFKDFWNTNKYDIKDWYNHHKDSEPKEESYDIWKNWYCK